MHSVATLMGPHAAMFELSVPCEVFGIHRAEIPGWPYRHVVCSPASETDLASWVLPVPAGPSTSTGLPRRSARNATPAMPSSAR